MLFLLLVVGVTSGDTLALSAPPLGTGQGAPPLMPPTNGHSLSGASNGLVVHTTAGVVRGALTGGMRVWRGLPYANPPIGQNRFEAPQRIEQWEGVHEAVRPSPACPQPLASPITPLYINSTSEDCLYIDIYAPNHIFNSQDGSTTESARMTADKVPRAPVIVWIQPGGFQFNAINQIDPGMLVKNGNVVLVPLQHRLGALGFAQENLGIRDVSMGLEWIKRNIGKFGGDPNRITILGAESGAVIVSILLQSPTISSQISGAIIHSAGPLSPWISDNPIQSAEYTTELARRLKCSTKNRKSMLICLKKVSVERILEVQTALCSTELKETCFVPVVEGGLVEDPRNHSDTINLPVIMGVNNNEGFLKMMKFLTREFPTEKLHSEGFSQEMYRKMLTKMFPGFDNQVLSVIEFLYSSGDSNDYSPTKASARFLALEKIFGDYLYTCGQHIQQEPAVQYNNLYKYRLAWRPSDEGWPAWSGVKQGSDLHFLLGKPFKTNNTESETAEDELNLQESERDLSVRMIQYWSNFAKTGSPNSGHVNDELIEVVEWPNYSPDTRLELELSALGDRQIQTSSTLTQRCNFWNQLLHTLIDNKEDCPAQGAEARSGSAEGDEYDNEIEQAEEDIDEEGREEEGRKEEGREEEKIDIKKKENKKYLSARSNTIKPRQKGSFYKRTVRGLNREPKEKKFGVKVRRTVPRDKRIKSSMKVMYDPRQNNKDFVSNFPQRQNNSKVSYQLSVDLDKNDDDDENLDSKWTVYDTRNQGNSPIYIAPAKYTENKETFSNFRDSGSSNQYKDFTTKRYEDFEILKNPESAGFNNPYPVQPYKVEQPTAQPFAGLSAQPYQSSTLEYPYQEPYSEFPPQPYFKDIGQSAYPNTDLGQGIQTTDYNRQTNNPAYGGQTSTQGYSPSRPPVYGTTAQPIFSNPSAGYGDSSSGYGGYGLGYGTQETDRNQALGYDPFYPNYKQKPALRMGEGMPVYDGGRGVQGEYNQQRLGENNQQRPYFPNYFPRQAI